MSSDRLAIRVNNLGKKYILGGPREQYFTFRDAIVNSIKAPFKRNNSQKSPDEGFWALKGISFNVHHGEVVGIIGRNGAGKSTLLKILSRITSPTEGTVELHGRVGSLLEVGTGFHPELTGRENIFLSGSILGMKKREIEQKFDEIVKFSEVEPFIDTPVKRFSSGMYVRLAFAVASHLQSEILIVDEVLAVGDVAFQKKCLGKMGNVAKEGRTVLFVSHNMGAIQRLCPRAILIENGKVIQDGNSGEVTSFYLNKLSNIENFNGNHKKDLILEKVLLKNEKGELTQTFSPGDSLEIELLFNAFKEIRKPKFIITVLSQFGSCFTANMVIDGKGPTMISGKGTIGCKFLSLPLLPQQYTIKIKVCEKECTHGIFGPQEIASFTVIGDVEKFGFDGEYRHNLISTNVPVIIPYVWRYPDGIQIPMSFTNNDNRRP